MLVRFATSTIHFQTLRRAREADHGRRTAVVTQLCAVTRTLLFQTLGALHMSVLGFQDACHANCSLLFEVVLGLGMLACGTDSC